MASYSVFDEAYVIFGKRSEVKDSHDRYANIEVSFLLQRMECYNGLAVLTTNLKSVVDRAFLRRLRFIVQFPYPDQVQRQEVWRRVFPSRTPLDELQFEKLAKLNMAGKSATLALQQPSWLLTRVRRWVRLIWQRPLVQSAPSWSGQSPRRRSDLGYEDAGH